MKFTKQFLLDMLDGKDVIEDRIDGKSRWAIQHRCVFTHEGKFFETFYQVAASESQDESPYENAPDEIECPEVFAVSKTITAYERAPQV